MKIPDINQLSPMAYCKEIIVFTVKQVLRYLNDSSYAETEQEFDGLRFSKAVNAPFTKATELR